MSYNTKKNAMQENKRENVKDIDTFYANSGEEDMETWKSENRRTRNREKTACWSYLACLADRARAACCTLCCCNRFAPVKQKIVRKRCFRTVLQGRDDRCHVLEEREEVAWLVDKCHNKLFWI